VLTTRRSPRSARPLLTGAAAALVLLAVLAFAAAARAGTEGLPTASATTARLGPPPVPCSPAPCGQDGQRPIRSGQLQESTKVHLTITPHAARPGQFVTMKIKYSNGAQCGFASTCGPQDPFTYSLVAVSCATHKPLPPPVGAHDPQLIATTRCYKVTPASATGAPLYAVFQAPIGDCGSSGGLVHPYFDCISEDYLLLLPSCNSPAAKLAPASADPCNKLDVTVKTLERSQSGLDKDAEAFFGGRNLGCFSGCTDVLVTVKDHHTHKPVGGALVSASVTPISSKAIPSYPSGDAGDGYLCAGTNPRRCGSGRLITGLRTNPSGHLRLRYWAPGLIADGQMKITAKATEACHKSGCPKAGEFTTKDLTVSRNLIYRHDATLSAAEARELANWAEGDLLGFGAKQSAEIGLNKYLDALVKTEKLAEHGAEKLGEGLERIAGLLEIAEVATAQWEQQGFMALFFDKFGLSGTGLGRAPEGSVVSAAPSGAFQIALAGDGIPPLHLAQKGLLWNYGAQLAFLRDEHSSEFGAQFIHLYVYEVSYCAQGEDCGPEYYGSKGIHPYLEFQFVADHSRLAQTFESHFLTPYNAQAWMDTQFGP
jgi:hypothetical protein